MIRPDPYADWASVYLSETIKRAHPTAKTPTDSDPDSEGDDLVAPEIALYAGFHIDGDKRYQER